MRRLCVLLLALASSPSALAGVNTWTSHGPGPAGATIGLVVDPVRPLTAYAAVSGAGVFKTTDGGDTWTAVSAGLTDMRLVSLVIDPLDPARLWAAVGAPYGGQAPGGVFRSTDGGQTWAFLAGSPNGSGAFAVDPVHPDTLYLGAEIGRIWKSTDAGLSWRNLDLSFIRSLAVDPSDPRVVYAGESGTFESRGDIWRSRDGGTTWEWNLGDNQVDAMAVDPRRSTHVYLGKNSAGVHRSTDGGMSWRISSGGLSDRRVHSLVIDPANPSTIYAGTSTGVYRSIDSGSRWTPFKTGLGEQSVTALAIESAGSRIYAATASGVYVLEVCDGSGCDATDSAVRVVPLVVDAPGPLGGRQTTELTLLNGGTSAADVHLELTPAAAFGGGPIVEARESLGPGQETTFADVVSYFRAKGSSIPTEGAYGGTLRVTFSHLSPSAPVAAIARTLAPSPAGPVGFGMWGREVDPARPPFAYLFGLRETDVERTDIALVNSFTDRAVSLSVTIYPSTPGHVPAQLAPVNLGPGQWVNLPSVLSSLGSPGDREGFAQIRQSPIGGFFDIGAPAGFLAYAVVTDRRTGSSAQMPATVAPIEPALVPALVETPRFETELVLGLLVNEKDATSNRLDVGFRDSLDSSGHSDTRSFLVPVTGQTLLPRAVDGLRSLGFEIGPRGAPHAGALSAAPAALAGAFNLQQFSTATSRVVARDSSGGAYSTGFLTYTEASTTGVVPGLIQDGSTRSNLALMNPGTQELAVRYQVFDESGTPFPPSEPLHLGPGEWRQVNAVLWPFGVSRGWVRVSTVCCTPSGESFRALPFFAYGVVNDGPSSGTGSGGGTYVPMNPR